jgi:hypothetical protein
MKGDVLSTLGIGYCTHHIISQHFQTLIIISLSFGDVQYSLYWVQYSSQHSQLFPTVGTGIIASYEPFPFYSPRFKTISRLIYTIEIMTQNLQENIQLIGFEPTTFDYMCQFSNHRATPIPCTFCTLSVYIVYAGSNSCVCSRYLNLCLSLPLLRHIGNMNPYC